MTSNMKPWGWTYLEEGKPATITCNDRDVLHLDPSLPSQMRQVRKVLRILNATSPKQRRRKKKP